MWVDWLALIALTWMVGSIGVSAITLQSDGARPLREATRGTRRAHTVLANALMLVASIAAIVYPPRHFADGRPLLIGLLRVFLILLIALLLWRGSRYVPVIFLAGNALLFTQSLLGRHAAGRDWFMATLGDWFHLVLSSLWIGGLGLLALVCIPAAARNASLRQPLAAMLQRFSPMALFCGLGLAASGIMQTNGVIDGLSELLGTAYGRTLLIKIALFAVIMAFGAFHQLAIVPRLRPMLIATDKPVNTTAFAFTVLMELMLGLAVLLVVATLRVQ